MTRTQSLQLAPLGIAAWLAVSGALAQSPTPTPDPAPAPAPAPQRVEITGSNLNDIDERRQSTAAKIIVGREEIERFGDTSTGEVLRRLPGITVGGAPRRGGAPRMRGMGAGFTQLLLNGERLPSGFSIDSIPPDQIDRIEVLRAPTAETGARAIAGTINIVTREGFRRRTNDLRAGVELERGRASPSLSWNRNDILGEHVIATTSFGLRHRDQRIEQRSTTVEQDLATGSVLQAYDEAGSSVERGPSVNLNSRIQWQPAEGHTLTVTPTLVYRNTDSDRNSSRTPFVDYAARSTTGRERQQAARVNGLYALLSEGGARWELRGSHADTRRRKVDNRLEFDSAGRVIRTLDDTLSWRDRQTSAGTRLAVQAGDDHAISMGAEVEQQRRLETRDTVETVNGGVQPSFVPDFGDALEATVRRRAVYLQDEWTVNDRWTLNPGIRWEGIDTQGAGDNGLTVRNRSSVATPLLHALYRLSATGRDQARLSLTRSYRTPTLAQLIARPNLASNNSLTSPDRYGNPSLRPEIARGVDLAFERYLAEGGLLSINLFHRRIQDLIRNVITVNPLTGRVEARPQNVGGATSQGIELEARGRLSQWIEGAPRVNLRANAAVYDSRVDTVPGPDNRLEAQARASVNLGADYRLRALPLTLGGNLSWSPRVVTRLADNQVTTESRKLFGEAFALWAFSENTRLRLTASNIVARDYVTSNSVDDASVVQTQTQFEKGNPSVGVRLELKL